MKTIRDIELFAIAFLLQSCSSSRSASDTFLSTIKDFSTCWYSVSDSTYKSPGDTVRFELAKFAGDTLVYPPWYSPSSRVDMSLKQRSAVSVELFNEAGTTHTKPVEDTLDSGNYAFRLLLDSTFKSGVYFVRSTVNAKPTVRKFIILK